MRKMLIVLLLALLVPISAQAKHEFLEREYQEQMCKDFGGLTEFVLADRTRVDCLTASHAIEFDFATKWAEAIGQSLHYAMMTGLGPGIVLIVEDVKNLVNVWRIKAIGKAYGVDIRVWIIEPKDMIRNDPIGTSNET